MMPGFLLRFRVCSAAKDYWTAWSLKPEKLAVISRLVCAGKSLRLGFSPRVTSACFEQRVQVVPRENNGDTCTGHLVTTAVACGT